MNTEFNNLKVKYTFNHHSDLYKHLNEFQLGELLYDVELDQMFMVGENGLMQIPENFLEYMDETIGSLEKVEGGVTMSMYEMNQQIISQLPTHNEEQIKEDIKIINEFQKKHETKYFILLCKEISYFTGFIKEFISLESLGEVVIDCLKAVGEIKDIDASDPVYLDIWVTTKSGETHCMHLFDFQYGVVEFGG